MGVWQDAIASFFPILNRRREPDLADYDEDVHLQQQRRMNHALWTMCYIGGARSESTSIQFTGEKVQTISEMLNTLYDEQWSSRPRTYIVLYNSSVASLMEKFIADDKTDLWLPYTEETLPDYVQPLQAREYFLDFQKYVLTDAGELEGMSTDLSSTKPLPHVHLQESGDLHFTKTKTLGKGTYGVVEEVYSCLSHRKYARKSVLRRRHNGAAQKYIAKELTELKQLSHRHLVKLLGSYTDTQHIAYLMLPVADYNLEDFLSSSSCDPHDLRTFFGCLTGAIDYLHRSKIRHRDLSSRNILVHGGRALISDFGSIFKWTENTRQGSMTQDYHVPAQRWYMAPEVARHQPRSSSSDMWSLGIIFMEITTVLVGCTLAQLKNEFNNDPRSNLPPFPWARPKLLIRWLDKLRQSNKGPRHDNEPLEWMAGLLNTAPKKRPKSGVLVQDIHDTQSFNIFCCDHCQLDFDERRLHRTYLTPNEMEEHENPADIMQSAAALLRITDAQPVVSAQKSSFIQGWLEDSQVRRPIPGQFELFEEDDEDKRGFQSHSSFYEAPKLRVKTFPIAAAVEVKPHVSISGTKQLSPLTFTNNVPSTDPPSCAKDTGLGFYEIDSPSSSHGGFWVLSDASGTDAGSESSFESAISRNDIQQSSMILPRLSGVEGMMIQTLDAFIEEDEEEEDTADREPHVNDVLNDLQSGPCQTLHIEVAASYHDPCEETQSSVEAHGTFGIHCNQSSQSPKSSENRSLSEGQDLAALFRSGEYKCSPTKLSEKEPNIPEDSEHRDDPKAEVGKKQSESHKISDKLEPQKAEEVQKLASDTSGMRYRKNSSKKRSAQGKSKAETESLGVPEYISDRTSRQDKLAPSSATRPGTKKKSDLESSRAEEHNSAIQPDYNGCGEASQYAHRRAHFSDNPVLETRSYDQEEDQFESSIMDPSDYIKTTWDSASSVATSVMSAQTKNVLKNVSINKWLDRDHKLLETFCSQGKAAAVRALLAKGCNPGLAKDRRPEPIFITVRGATSKHNKCVRALIHADVDVNVVNKSSGKTPLHYAIENPIFKGYEQLICALIAAGANTNAKDHRGNTPITRIFDGKESGPLEEHRRKALALLLREEDTDVNVALPGTSNTPLHLAVRRKDPFAAGMLIFRKADINAKNAAGSTPLLVAANQFRNPMSNAQISLLGILLTAEDIRVNEKAGVKEQTALHYAIQAGVSTAVERLLEHGADPRCQDSDGCDADMLAARCAERWIPEDRDSIMLQLESIKSPVSQKFIRLPPVLQP